jgi:hypothetical protein
MSFTDPTVAPRRGELAAQHLDTLRRAQLAQTVETVRMSGDALHALSEHPDVSDPLGDVAAYTRTIRADLDALEALGYQDREDRH